MLGSRRSAFALSPSPYWSDPAMITPAVIKAAIYGVVAAFILGILVQLTKVGALAYLGYVIAVGVGYLAVMWDNKNDLVPNLIQGATAGVLYGLIQGLLAIVIVLIFAGVLAFPIMAILIGALIAAALAAVGAAVKQFT